MLAAYETSVTLERKEAYNSGRYLKRNITKAYFYFNTMKKVIKESPNMSFLIGVNIINAIFMLVM